MSEDIYIYTTKVLGTIVSRIEEMEKTINQLTNTINNLRETQSKLIEVLQQGFEAIMGRLEQRYTMAINEANGLFEKTVSRLEKISIGGNQSVEQLSLILSSFTNNINKVLLLYQLVNMFENLMKKIEESKTASG